MSVHDRLFEEKRVRKNGPVECLGVSFESNAARRECFLEILKDHEFRWTKRLTKGISWTERQNVCGN